MHCKASPETTSPHTHINKETTPVPRSQERQAHSMRFIRGAVLIMSNVIPNPAAKSVA
jgi:hypothetical protein